MKTSWMQRVDKTSKFLGEAVSILILLIVAITVFEVVMRYAFNSPTIWVHETSTFLFSYAFLLGGAYTLKLGRHVSVDVVTRKFSPETKRVLELIMALFFFTFMALFVWKTAEWAWDSILEKERAHSVWEPYIFPVIIAVPVSAILMLLQGVVRFIRVLKRETGQEDEAQEV